MKYLKTEKEFYEIIKGEKVLIDFYADWCGPCNMLATVLEEVVKERTDIEIVKVNTDTFMNLAREYKVMSIPALKIFSNGKLIKEQNGFLTKNELLEFLK